MALCMCCHCGWGALLACGHTTADYCVHGVRAPKGLYSSVRACLCARCYLMHVRVLFSSGCCLRAAVGQRTRVHCGRHLRIRLHQHPHAPEAHRHGWRQSNERGGDGRTHHTVRRVCVCVGGWMGGGGDTALPLFCAARHVARSLYVPGKSLLFVWLKPCHGKEHFTCFVGNVVLIHGSMCTQSWNVRGE